MIPDSQTNFLYLADSLPKKYPDFYKRFETTLSESAINSSLLPGTKDIWAVDYMPIQVDKNAFIQFVYNPDYLYPDLLQTISDVGNICAKIGLRPKKSNIKLDGGNVVKGNDCIIMCDKIFSENPQIDKKELIKTLKNLFEVEDLIFIPTDPSDVIGHADGIVRFINDKTVVINGYSEKDNELKINLKNILKKAGLDYIEIMYNPYANKRYLHANGIYINYLQMEGVIILPIFNLKEDDIAFKQFESIFADHVVKTIESNEIAKQGGILNCITWNIKQEIKKISPSGG